MKNKKLPVMLLLLVLLTVSIYSAYQKETYRITIQDKSGTYQDTKSSTDTDMEDAAQEPADGGGAVCIASWMGRDGAEKKLLRQTQESLVRVLLKTSGYTGIFHKELTLEGDTGEIALTVQKLKQEFEILEEACREQGYNLEQMMQTDDNERHYRISRQDGERIRQCSIERSCGYPAYRGALELYATKSSQLVIINELPQEEYLYSVLPSEMPSSYPPEALKAQAVCARTFLFYQIRHQAYPQYGAFGDDSTSCQVYANIQETEATSAAVEETGGLYIGDGGQLPICSYYFSTSACLPSDTGMDVETYLYESYDDLEQSEDWYRWSYTVSAFDREVLAGRVRARYQAGSENVSGMEQELGEIQSLEITERSPNGSASALTIRGTKGTWRVYGEYHIRCVLTDGITDAKGQNQAVMKQISLLPSGFFVLKPILDNGILISYSIYGGGFGHGNGMSQNGAKQLALQGKNVQDILCYYY